MSVPRVQTETASGQLQVEQELNPGLLNVSSNSGNLFPSGETKKELDMRFNFAYTYTISLGT